MPIIWTLLILIVADLGISFLTKYPEAPAGATINSVQRYFNYGRSIEDKVRWMAGSNDAVAAGLAKSGWLHREQDRKASADPGRETLVAFYGMSFSSRVGLALEEVNKKISARLSGGPAATVSRSYADYLLDRGNHDAKVIVLGVLASSIEASGTVTHMTWNFENPGSHFYPKFYLDGTVLARLDPPVSSLSEFREHINDEAKWQVLKEFVAQNDPYYDPFTFNASVLDHSIIARLIRRAWAQNRFREKASAYQDEQGFTNHEDSIDVTLKTIQAMAGQSREDGHLFIALLINNRGYDTKLYDALHGSLEQEKIVHLSTHEIVRPDVFSNFQEDGHFQPRFDPLIAAELSTLIKRQSAR